jgi:hypothetical protein
MSEGEDKMKGKLNFAGGFQHPERGAGGSAVGESKMSHERFKQRRIQIIKQLKLALERKVALSVEDKY